MVSVALMWDWRRFAAVLGLGFLGIARPGEPLAALRGVLLLPRDRVQNDSFAAYLKIVKPKTRNRGGGAVQHISADDAEFIAFLDWLYGFQDGGSRLFDCSPGAFRRRWNAILKAWRFQLKPPEGPVEEVVSTFFKVEQIFHVYCREVVASTMVCELPTGTRDKVLAASSLTSCLLRGVAIA